MIVLSIPPTPIAGGGGASPSSPPGSTPLGETIALQDRVALRARFSTQGYALQQTHTPTITYTMTS